MKTRLPALVAAAALVGCTPQRMPPPPPPPPQPVTCVLETEFIGYLRDPGPHRHYPASCSGKTYQLQEFRPGTRTPSDCVAAPEGTLVRLTPGGDAWDCEVLP